MRRLACERLFAAATAVVTATVRRRCGCANACSQNSRPYEVLRGEGSNVEVRAWIRGVEVERSAHEQLLQLSRMGEIIRHPIAVMPDVHTGHGATVGTVIPTTGALIPASVGVDIGCGMIAVRTTLTPQDLPGSLTELRLAVEIAVPHGRTHNGRSGLDAGSWRGDIPKNVAAVWNTHLRNEFYEICASHKAIEASNHISHLGTLGGGNHFIELCVDDADATNNAQDPHVWVMLHSGSRGVGNRIGTVFIELAKKDMGNHISKLPSADLAYLREGSPHFDQYVKAVDWAQRYAKWNREIMLQNVLQAIRSCIPQPFSVDAMAINCHHNYIEHVELDPQNHVWLTRKGATSARGGELAVIPGSMGAKSYIVRGKGSPLSYSSCSHGAGRRYSRGEARRRFTLEDHEAATADVECRKDTDVLDETPLAYKKIDDVMQAQGDLVEVVCTLKQVLCVKG
ncbi:tRNA-splicing ligase RtcB [Trypanosoma rangeli]|uniref:3'-phosphate/5'-hydroxy nucleic acid ligase n=1 Tax=Trypanosoma rangeli TaxID=5698 RepID=A0A422N518_TRYRA|nr:tRNA-splicing ligase RtcB [Trypanosoma rangeli]RNF00578.1 tRNA-splicing ligase RtcB [Trypanosoma rangeli]|eukprot:RNF00578.1 tRNA-splicing ligase RtcB [Trypanosoma rangeli]